MSPTTDEATAARMRHHAAQLVPPMHVDAAAAIARGRRRRRATVTTVSGVAAGAVVVAAVAVSTLAPGVVVVPASESTPVPTVAASAVDVVRPAVGVEASTGPGAGVDGVLPLGSLGGVPVRYEPPQGERPARVVVAGDARPITLPFGSEQQVGASSVDVGGGRVSVLAVPTALTGARAFLVSAAGWDTASGRTAVVEVPVFTLPGEPSGRAHAVFRVDAVPADRGVDTVLVGADGTYVTTASCDAREACTVPAAVAEQLRRLTGQDELRPHPLP